MEIDANNDDKEENFETTKVTNHTLMNTNPYSIFNANKIPT